MTSSHSRTFAAPALTRAAASSTARAFSMHNAFSSCSLPSARSCTSFASASKASAAFSLSTATSTRARDPSNTASVLPLFAMACSLSAFQQRSFSSRSWHAAPTASWSKLPRAAGSLASAAGIVIVKACSALCFRRSSWRSKAPASSTMLFAMSLARQAFSCASCSVMLDSFGSNRFISSCAASCSFRADVTFSFFCSSSPSLSHTFSPAAK
mmetsp:Transcript_28291/g.65625  ORF Transcript_28291/g.65625 Transcript_28291/m.65625 type:complete len:212 (+) Transcript_28291:331-966(+)